MIIKMMVCELRQRTWNGEENRFQFWQWGGQCWGQWWNETVSHLVDMVPFFIIDSDYEGHLFSRTGLSWLQQAPAFSIQVAFLLQPKAHVQMHLSFCPLLLDKGWVQGDWVGHGDVKMSCLRQRGKPCTPPRPGLGHCIHKQPVWMPVIFFCQWYFLNTQGADLVSPGSLALICYCCLVSFPACAAFLGNQHQGHFLCIPSPSKKVDREGSTDKVHTHWTSGCHSWEHWKCRIMCYLFDRETLRLYKVDQYSIT